MEIAPEPSEEERRAILAALEVEHTEMEEPSPWRRAGLEPDADQEPLANLNDKGRRLEQAKPL